MTANVDEYRGAVGDWLYNPVTGEVGRLTVSPYETDGQLLEGDLWLQPGAAVLGAHVHSALFETFEVISGRLTYLLDGVEHNAEPGAAARIAPGVVHDWWNGGDEPAQIHTRIESSDPGRPMATRFLSMIELAWGLGAAGETNARGLPGILWLAALADEYRDVLQMVKPPAAVQRAVFGPLAAIARRRGRHPLDPRMHGRHCPAWIPPPDEATLAEMLARRAPAKDAR